MKRLILALTLVLAACEGGPFNPHGDVQQDECHPQQWKNEETHNTEELLAYQAECKRRREQGK